MTEKIFYSICPHCFQVHLAKFPSYIKTKKYCEHWINNELHKFKLIYNEKVEITAEG